jgi:hypothetical protein
MFWRVFWGNAVVLVAVVMVLVFGPLQLSAPLTLADHMRRHDPLAPGGRVEVTGGPKVTALARAFNDMLDRLEAAQRESARHALMVATRDPEPQDGPATPRL